MVEAAVVEPAPPPNANWLMARDFLSSVSAGTARPLRRHAWADLLRRVFAVEVLECPDCGGRMRILAI